MSAHLPCGGVPFSFSILRTVSRNSRSSLAVEPTTWLAMIEEDAWHARLLNGSDYPLPGVMPVFSVDYLVSLKLIEEKAAAVLKDTNAALGLLRHNGRLRPIVAA